MEAGISLTSFRDPEAAERTLGRIEVLTGLNLATTPAAHRLDEAWAENPNADLALLNLERWLSVTTSPDLHLQMILGLPALGRLLVTILGSSQPLADSLIQNPELGSLILEPGQLEPFPERARIVEEGKRLLHAATSYSHSLDRLRFLRQRWNLPTVINDLSGRWTQENVWLAISELADGLIELTREAVWSEQRKTRDLPPECPVMIVGFGKLGGHELNYSSDVDLVYVCEDGLPEKLDRDCGKFCEAFGRALSDRMGRGFLYRVDLRLRPEGGAGPIIRSMRSVESYYKLYAEPWEVQALLRSRPIVGPPALVERWSQMRVRSCFRPKLSEMALKEMLAMRARIEQGATDDDLKRGPGGIRDVEFLTQVFQLLHGFERSDLQVLPTCAAIRALEAGGILEHPVAAALIEGYTFLRKLEHRTQLVGDQQTHQVPSDPQARTRLARSMDFSDWPELSQRLQAQRRTIQILYRSSLHIDSSSEGHTEGDVAESRAGVAAELGVFGPAALQWFDVLPEASAFYAGLAQDPSSLGRVRQVLDECPRLVANYKSSLALTELLLSGEIEDMPDGIERLQKLSVETPLATVAETFRSIQTVTLTQWIFEPTFELGPRLAALTDAVLLHCAKRLYVDFDIVATGSYGSLSPGPGSDADLVFLLKDRSDHAAAEQQAQHYLRLISQLHRLGASVEIDLRLRPEGGKGLLVRTYDGFRGYDLDGMEMWERFALGFSRLLKGSEEAFEVVRHSAYGLPLTPERLRELTKMKRRVETERVMPQHVRRDVKLGAGGLNDIEWLVHLHEMRYPEATGAAKSAPNGRTMVERIRGLARVNLINALESELLQAAHKHLIELRNRIWLLGLSDDLMPENPDRLDRLAKACGLQSANDLLAKHREITEAVRRLYTEALERLRP